MNRKDWEKSKKQMRQMLDKGIAELKELAAEASFMTDATSNVVKLEMDVHRLRGRLERAQVRLGREVARSAQSDGSINTTAAMKRLVKEIRTLESAIQQDEKKIKKTPLSWAAARKAVTQKNRRSGTKRTGKRTGTTRKKKAARRKSSSAGKQISKR